ncbi:MAG: ribosomal RNA small subunit methyltransferase A [Candidatus Yanofskybacteria bacterium]|nr:ribosomal RNA small subunit methyltransferase A [Candidatus Yanofskybacteria bacterium]
MTNTSTTMHNIDIPAKRSLGQNFLINEGVLDRIVEAADITPSDTILEVGPGKGALTQRLAKTGARIIAIEKDRRLIAPLRALFAAHPTVTIEEGDILGLELSSWNLAAGSYKVVANIPYYLTGQLFRRMLELWPSPSRAILMVQREVADRLLATPPNMNLLALSVRLFAEPSIVMQVSRGSFRPIPEVDSTVVRLDIRNTDEATRRMNAAVLTLAKKAFGQKRKQLTATIPLETLLQAGIAPTVRPQELSVEDWLRIASTVQ